MIDKDDRLTSAFAQRDAATARPGTSGADLADVRDRMRRRRARRAAVAGSVATLLVIGGVGLVADRIGDDPGGVAGVPRPTEPAASSLSLATGVTGEVRISGFTASCDDTVDLDGSSSRPPLMLTLEGMELLRADEEDMGMAYAEIRLRPGLVSPGRTVELGGRDGDGAAFGVIRGMEASTQVDGSDVTLEVVDGRGCTPGSVVTIVVRGSMESEADTGVGVMPVRGTASARVLAAAGTVDPTGELATDCSALRRRDVPEGSATAVALAAPGFAEVRFAGSVFVVDSTDPTCAEAPGIGEALTDAQPGLG